MGRPALSQTERDLHDLLVTDHVGHQNAISSSELAAQLGIDEANGNPVTRFAIRKIMRETGLPIASVHDGYFVIANAAELEAYIDDLNSRIAGIEDRIDLVRQCFYQDGPRPTAQQHLGEYASIPWSPATEQAVADALADLDGDDTAAADTGGEDGD